MNKNRKMIKGVAIAVTGVMLAGQTGSAVFSAAEEKQQVQNEKEETVYVKADPKGSASEIIVSDWLKNPDGAEVLEDISGLSDIENVKGEEGYTQEGDKITWNAGGNDIYYQGTSTRELPVEVEVSYYLDGEKIEPEALAGKSGHVKIVFSYKNKLKNGEVYTPFVMATGLILPAENFKNVKTENAKLISDGEKNIVIGFGLPGMNDNLKMEDSDLTKELDIDFPESFEIEADVTDFELAMSMTVAGNLDLSDLDLTDIKDKDELQEKIDEMKDGATQLVDGTGELADGVQELKDSCQELIEGMTSVDEGMGTLNDGVTELNTKKNDLVDGINELVDGIDTLNRKKGDLISGVNELADGIYTLDNSKGTLVNGVNELAQGASQLDSGAGALKTGTRQLVQGTETLNTGKNQLVAGVDKLADGINGDGTAGNPGLLNGAKELAAGLKLLAESVNGSENSGSLSAGIAQLKTGAAALTGAIDQQILPGIGLLQSKIAPLGQGLVDMKTGIDRIAGSDSAPGALDAVIGGMDAYLTSGAGVQTAAEADEGQTDASGEQTQTVFAQAEITPSEAAPDAVSMLTQSLEANRSVLASLQSVKETAGSVKLPEAMSALAGTYNSYMGELDSCIAQLESAIAAQETALAALSQVQTVDVEAEVPVAIQETQPQDETGESGTVAVKTSDLATWSAILGQGKGGLQEMSSQLGGVLAQMQGDGSSENPGLNAGIEALKNGISSGNAQQPGMKEGLQQLSAGIEKLSAGVDTDLAGGISRLQTGADALAAGVQQVADGVNSTYNANGTIKKVGLRDGIHSLGSGISQVNSGAGELNSGAANLKAGTGRLNSGALKLAAGAGTLSDGVGRLADGAGQLQSGAATLGSGVQELADGGSQLRNGGAALADGIEELASGSGELKEGTAKLAEGGSELDEGVDKLNDGAIELRDGMDEFNEKAIEKITDVLENDLQDFIDHLDLIKEAGEGYRSYSGGAESVKFIIETGSIEAE